MGSEVNITHYKRIYLDTSLYIYFFENNPSFADKVEYILRLSTDRKISIIASSLLLTELLVAPIKKKDQTLIDLYKNLPSLLPTLIFADYNYKMGLVAAQLRAHYNLPTPDAIHLATAIITQADVFISTDKNLRNIKEINVLIL